ncbi:MAG: hypothetical protein NWE93_06290 [Candidatus Bathyarchaeota archaeon]|nr:hypothetical protein [Candidatus Bathyarchaeota archaeon]
MTSTSSIQIVIDEIKNLAPDIHTALVFRGNGDVLANTENATAEQTQALISSLGSIDAQAIGGIESFTIQDINSQLAITAVGDTFLATESSRTGNQKAAASLIQVVIPAVIRLSTENTLPEAEALEEVEQSLTATTNLPVEVPENPLIPEPTLPAQPFLPNAPTSQFMVERVGGLLVAQDAVRIDCEVVESWRSLYGDRELLYVEVVTLEGKSVTCKFKLQKEGKSNIKGVIQIPDKILQTLQCDKGKLVMVKPKISEENQ